VAVELDDEPWRVVPAEAVVRAGLAVGRPLDRERARALARALRRAEAVSRATRALGRRECSRSELEAQLVRAGVPATTRRETLEALEDSGLVDDTRAASARAEELARRGYGDAAIRSDLLHRGIVADTASVALAALEPEPDRARRLLGRHGTGPRELRRLVARGFEQETVLELASFAAGE
jgi:SOS response regulatory protein OraA/RecX